MTLKMVTLPFLVSRDFGALSCRVIGPFSGEGVSECLLSRYLNIKGLRVGLTVLSQPSKEWSTGPAD